MASERVLVVLKGFLGDAVMATPLLDGVLSTSRTGGIDQRENDAGMAHVHDDQPLGQALARMGETGHTVLPVVSRANVRRLLGVVTLEDVLRAYGVERLDQLSPSEMAADE